MNFWENIELSFNGLLVNKMRAFLTMLGIIIGIGSVIAIFTVGDSFTNGMNSTMQSMGANNITVAVRQKDSENSGVGFLTGNSTQQQIDDRDKIQKSMISDLESTYGGQIKSVSLSNTVGSGKTTVGKSYANLSLMGINRGYITANNIKLTEGRFFTDAENQAGKKLCVVSDKYAGNLGLTGNVIGQQVDIRVNDLVTTYTIVGIYEYQQSTAGFTTSSDKDLSTNAYIPISVANQMSGTSSYQSFAIVTNVGVNSTDFASTVQTFMANYYQNNKDYTVSATSMESLVDSMSSILNTLKIAISAIAAIALLVGGIGVMNIMLVSITERTREIGTRKALGAKNSSIRIQFITESALICLIGGIIGILFGSGLGLLVSRLLGYPGSASVTDILLAVGFSIVIGVFFGYYPANKAAKLDPIEALRYE
jgi:putative ABC transport system permease protein